MCPSDGVPEDGTARPAPVVALTGNEVAATAQEAAVEAAVEATQHGHTETLATILASRTVAAGVRDAAGVPLLHWAALNGHAGAAQLLLANGAPVDAVAGRLGETALQVSVVVGWCWWC